MQCNPRAAALCLVASTFMSAAAAAGEALCSLCGRRAPCEKVCRLVKSEKQVEVVCWGERREEFCVPGPSKLRGARCEVAYDSCGVEDAEISSKPRWRIWFDWRPGGAKLYTRTRLMKRVETKTNPVQTWVAVDLCPACRAGNAAPGEPGAGAASSWKP